MDELSYMDRILPCSHVGDSGKGPSHEYEGSQAYSVGAVSAASFRADFPMLTSLCTKET